ncbi:MAG: spermidine/putrescine ABC transporter ATP-binding protein PotA [Desulfobulbaceae bacterium]|nr:MAG: spermidine/putrescine ABC transporter ATP-binding protein PotA [Desulfobulbaceae bacterium]
MKKGVLTITDLSKSFDGLSVVKNFNLVISQGEFVTLLGPSGCGKTTLLRLIAGFDKPDSGTIMLDDKDIGCTPPEKRQVNTVFQSYALFPHMTVFDNIAFGLKITKTKKSELLSRVQNVLKQTQLESLAHRFPSQLSGGQQQRVAMARAVVNRPRVLLLDEPLSALDARLRQEMQIELKKLQRNLNITTILVTHEQDEALSLSDRIVVMNQGAIAQIGTPREIYEEPKNLYVARFIGEINQLPARVEEVNNSGNLTINVLGKNITIAKEIDCAKGDRVHLLLRPEDLRISGDIDEAMPRFSGSIIDRRYRGATLDTTIRLDTHDITLQACEFFDEDDPDFDYSIGEKVEVSWVPGWEVLLKDET